MAFGRSPAKHTAVVCENGHRLTGHAEEFSHIPKFCDRCGAPNLMHCPRCNAPIPGDAPHVRVLMDKRPPAYCGECGEPYPWRAASLRRLAQVTAMQVELNSLDPATTEALNSFVADVVASRATPEQASTFGRWFTMKVGVEGAKAVGGVLKDVASSIIADTIRKTMMGG